MPRLRLTANARQDLARIQDYIFEDSASATTARRFVDKLRSRCRRLAALTMTMGRPRPELGEGLRSYPEGNYLIFFRYVGDVLEVVNIIEGHRDIATMFDDDTGQD